MLVEEKNMIVL